MVTESPKIGAGEINIENILNRVIHGDCFKILPRIPNNSIDFIITDPPYGIKKKGINDTKDSRYYNKPFKEMFRVLKPNSFCLTFASIEKLNRISRKVSQYFDYEWSIICYQPNNMIRGRLGFSKYFMLLVFSKGEPTYKEPMRDVLVYNVHTSKRGKINHPTTKPVYFFRRVIEKLTDKGDIVLDPFIGSGTTAIACKQLSRNYIGIEIKEKYCKISRNRLDNHEEPLTNFKD